ncbi:MAG: hypothetical protein V7L14_33225 [Nostoc sp.]
MNSPTTNFGQRIIKFGQCLMKNLGGNIKSLRNFMRKDPGVSGDGQRIEQLGWLLFLKILDASDRELELLKDNFVSVIPQRLRWCNWAISAFIRVL